MRFTTTLIPSYGISAMADGTPAESVAVHAPPERIIEGQLDDRLEAIEKEFKGPVISFFGPLVYGTEEMFRDASESIAADGDTSKLMVILETNGGFIEVVQRIAEILRHHFDRVEFLVPNFAMSAGTVLVMSGDAIHMDYFSILGPIDPQVQGVAGQPIPALGYLVQYERLIKKAEVGELNTAELAFLTQKFDPAELYRYEQARELSISLLEDWLAQYKFKDWTETATRKETVTPDMKRERATEIAKKLSNPDEWHSHARGISMEVLRQDLNLQIEDFGKKKRFRSLVQVYCKLMRDYMVRRGQPMALHRRGEYVAS